MSTEKKHPLAGRKLSTEHKEKIGQSKMGKTHSQEACKKISEATRGERNPNLKLSLDDCREILFRYSNRGSAGITETLAELAKQYNVTPLTIRKIKDGSHWSCKVMEGENKT